jgi:acetyl esterase/lipase
MVGGESAGGGLTAAVTLLARDRKKIWSKTKKTHING